MPSPPFGAGLVKLNHELLAWRVPEISSRRAHIRCCLAKLRELIVSHFLQPNAQRLNVKFIEADR